MSKMPVEEWLSNLSSEVQPITRESCAVARKSMPGAHEFIYHDAVGDSTSDSPYEDD